MTKKIVYVGKSNARGEDFTEKSEREKRREIVYRGLVRDYEVLVRFDLSARVVHEILDNLEKPAGERYSALVSHFPINYNFLRAKSASGLSGKEFLGKAYGFSSGLIGRIRTIHRNFPMIAYTGASAVEGMLEVLATAGFNDVVFKSDDCHKDAEKISEKLKRLGV